MDLLNSFLFSLIEVLGFVGLSLLIATGKVEWKKILLFSVCLTIMLLVLRNIKVFQGIHTVVLLLTVLIFLYKRIGVDVVRSFLAITFSLFVLALLEFLFNRYLLNLLPFDREKNYLLVCYLQSFLYLFIVLVLKRLINLVGIKK